MKPAYLLTRAAQAVALGWRRQGRSRPGSVRMAGNAEEKRIALLIDADNAPAAKIDVILTEVARYGVEIGRASCRERVL